MKQVTAYTENVAQATVIFEALVNRSPNVPGIGLLDGKAGYGKTFATIKLHNSMEDSIHLRAVRLDTATTFLDRLAKELSIKDIPRSRMGKFECVVDELAQRDYVLFIDEADYYMGQPELLEIVRDLHDMARTTIILVGMDQIARRVARLPQLDSRISQRYEFQPATVDDLMVVAESAFEYQVEVARDLLARIVTRRQGVLRYCVIDLEKVEARARTEGVMVADLKWWGDADF